MRRASWRCCSSSLCVIALLSRRCVQCRPSVATPHAAARAESSRADRPHRLLGVDRHAGLALAHGDAGERRLPGHSADPEGRKVADAWDPAKDEAAGEQCKSYGAPALMSVPGRIHITWQDDTTLKVEPTRACRRDCCTSARSGSPSTPLGTAGGCAPHLAGRLAGGVAETAPGRAAAVQAGGSRRGRAAAPPDRRIAARRRPRTSAPDTCGRTASPTARTPC